MNAPSASRRGAGSGRCLGVLATLAALAALAMAGACGGEAPAATRQSATSVGGDVATAEDPPPPSAPRAVAPEHAPEPAASTPARVDSGPWTEARAEAEAGTGLRVLVSLAKRTLWVIDGNDTLRTAPVGVGMDSTLAYEGQRWHFRTPRGLRRVRARSADPVWVPPEWHYVEAARAAGLGLARIPAGRPLELADGSRIEVRDGDVGIVRAGVPFTPFALDEEIVWDGTLYIPPLGTKQRAITGELGRYRLDLGDGYLLHGTPYTASVGQASSHGCLRLGDDDIAWLYEHVPLGTPVAMY